MCLGDVLARMKLFLLFSTLLHKFHIELPEGESLPSLKGNTGVTVTPQAFKVSLQRIPSAYTLTERSLTGTSPARCPHLLRSPPRQSPMTSADRCLSPQ